mmetsp:Transcript_42212/g.100607  ORF Transcript_42212/g.100607 Transcript_42212/m.100607 type:complete len:444 (-) Transcript_42212:15081-16412(-)
MMGVSPKPRKLNHITIEVDGEEIGISRHGSTESPCRGPFPREPFLNTRLLEAALGKELIHLLNAPRARDTTSPPQTTKSARPSELGLRSNPPDTKLFGTPGKAKVDRLSSPSAACKVSPPRLVGLPFLPMDRQSRDPLKLLGPANVGNEPSLAPMPGARGRQRSCNSGRRHANEALNRSLSTSWTASELPLPCILDAAERISSPSPEMRTRVLGNLRPRLLSLLTVHPVGVHTKHRSTLNNRSLGLNHCRPEGRRLRRALGHPDRSNTKMISPSARNSGLSPLNFCKVLTPSFEFAIALEQHESDVRGILARLHKGAKALQLDSGLRVDDIVQGRVRPHLVDGANDNSTLVPISSTRAPISSAHRALSPSAPLLGGATAFARALGCHWSLAKLHNTSGRRVALLSALGLAPADSLPATIVSRGSRRPPRSSMQLFAPVCLRRL